MTEGADPATGRPRVAIVIPTADPEREPARSAIAQARATTAHLGATVHVITSSGPGFRFSRSVNRGIAEAPDADAWVLLNDDCFMDEGWLDAMLAAAQRHPQVGIVGAVLRFPNGRLQHAGGYAHDTTRYLRYNTFRKAAPLWAWRNVRRAAARDACLFGHYRRVSPRHRLDFVTGACMLITRACRERIGGYDEGYEFSLEDVDYCLRALQAGLEVAFATKARGVHLERTTGKHLHREVDRSVERFNERWNVARVLAATRRGGRRGFHD